VTVLVKRIMDATIGSVLHATTSISHSEQNATSAENQSQEAADAEVVTLTDVADVMEVAVSVETGVVVTPTDVEDVMADEALGEDEEVVTLTDGVDVMAVAVSVETEVVVTLTDVEDVMADEALVEDEEIVTPTDVEDVMADEALVEDEEIVTPTDVEDVMADEALVEDEEIVTPTDAEAVMVAVTQDVVVTTEVAMMNVLTNVIGKHVESAQATLTIVAQNQFDHVVTKGIIETIEVDLRDSRSALS
jgi:hypothetical protein